MKCPHGFDKPTQCVDCMMDGPVVDPPTWVKVPQPFAAKFDGECSCGPIRVGDVVERWDLNGTAPRTVYRHPECAP